MFGNCLAIKTIPPIDTSKGTDFRQMFTSCYLASFPSLNIFSGSYFDNMFSNCSNLTSISIPYNLSASSFVGMFTGCNNLQSASLTITAGNVFSSMFQNCNSLQIITPLTTSKATDLSNMFQGCSALRKVTLTGSRQIISYNGCYLDRNALINVFNNLGTAIVSGSTTITITNNPGSSSLTAADKAIANSKGWKIV